MMANDEEEYVVEYLPIMDDDDLELHDIEFMDEGAPDPMFDYVDPNLQSPLVLAVMADDPIRIQELLDAGRSPNINDNQGNTPLHVAVLQKKWKAFQLLLHSPDIRLDVENFEGITPLLLASYLCQDDYSEELLKAGADASLCDLRGNTVLHYFKTTKLAQLAIQGGADFNALDSSDCTPLQKACYSGSEELACMYLYYGADPNLGDPARCPLTPAVLFDKCILTDHLYEVLFIPKVCPLNLIIAIMTSESQLFLPIMAHIDEVDRTYELEDLSQLIIESHPYNFKVFIKRFKHLRLKIAEAYLSSCCSRFRFDQNLENLNYILRKDKFLHELALNVRHEHLQILGRSDDDYLFAYFAMSLGVPMQFTEFERTRYKYGRNSEHFKIMRHMDINPNIYGVCQMCWSFGTERNWVNYYNCIDKHREMHEFFTVGEENGVSLRKPLTTPRSLKEIGRNAAYEYLTKRFSIKTWGMYLSIVNSLPIDRISKGQLAYEITL